MRRDQNIGCIPQWVVARQWLRIRHIECCAADLFRFESFDESRLINHLATRNIGNVGARRVAGIEDLEFRRGEEVGCFFAEESLVHINGKV